MHEKEQQRCEQETPGIFILDQVTKLNLLDEKAESDIWDQIMCQTCSWIFPKLTSASKFCWVVMFHSLESSCNRNRERHRKTVKDWFWLCCITEISMDIHELGKDKEPSCYGVIMCTLLTLRPTVLREGSCHWIQFVEMFMPLKVGSDI